MKETRVLLSDIAKYQDLKNEGQPVLICR